MSMSKTDLKLWAREEFMDAINKRLGDLLYRVDHISVDEEMVFRKERDRVARFLGLEE